MIFDLQKCLLSNQAHKNARLGWKTGPRCVLSVLIYRKREQDWKEREPGDKGTGSESFWPPCPDPFQAKSNSVNENDEIYLWKHTLTHCLLGMRHQTILLVNCGRFMVHEEWMGSVWSRARHCGISAFREKVCPKYSSPGSSWLNKSLLRLINIFPFVPQVFLTNDFSFIFRTDKLRQREFLKRLLQIAIAPISMTQAKHVGFWYL